MMGIHVKPLNGKAYGSIPHLPTSRMGTADHSIHEGQEAICCVKARDRHDRIIVTEKLDGSCCTVANVDGKILAITRSGYLAKTSPFAHLQMFNDWVDKNTSRFLSIPQGARVCGEWMAMAHGTIYELYGEPFVCFDVIEHGKRWPHDEARSLIAKMYLEAAHVVSDGGPITVSEAMKKLGPHGYHNATETIEGAVWRVERKGQFDFMAKWVNPTKVDGKYLPEISGQPPIWLTQPSLHERIGGP